jgi:hypothetical protein
LTDIRIQGHFGFGVGVPSKRERHAAHGGTGVETSLGPFALAVKWTALAAGHLAQEPGFRVSILIPAARNGAGRGGVAGIGCPPLGEDRLVVGRRVFRDPDVGANQPGRYLCEPRLA